MYSVPNENRRALVDAIETLVRDGGDLGASIDGLIQEWCRIGAEASPEALLRGEQFRSAVLAAGVTHWSTSDGEWRPVSIGGHEAAEGADGAPDVVPVVCLPGGAGTEAKIVGTILSMSGINESEAARIARFRGGS
jgi:hypothetical protein